MCLLAVLVLSCRRGVEQELAAHWVLPVPNQGNPPAAYSEIEKRLDPQACGTCHVEKFADWSTSAHGRAFSKGLVAQLPELDFSVQKNCLKCHTPLSEQISGYFKAVQQSENNAGKTGITCAGCHVRAHERYGPGLGRLSGKAHGGSHKAAFFEDSRFCSACHQFTSDQTRVQGKLLQNVYEEWRVSSFAPDTTCQKCHMAGERHRWPGIQDRAFTDTALRRELVVRDGVAIYTLENSGAGHNLPAYSVPEIHFTLEAYGRDGERVVLDTYIVGWRLTTDLKHEIFDQRLASGARLMRSVPLPRDKKIQGLRLLAEVSPKAHYERLFASKHNLRTNPLLREALEEFRRQHYALTPIEIQIR